MPFTGKSAVAQLVTSGEASGYNGFKATREKVRRTMTKYWLAPDDYNPQHEAILEAAVMLREGKQVGFPTETVYGLGADARNTEAVEGIFLAKGRPSDNPLIVHIADMTMLEELSDQVDEVSRRLAEAFWPGPLTLVLPLRKGAVSPRVTAGLDTVAVRMPDHPVALALITAAGCPVAAPSANRSGRPSPTLAEHVRGDLGGRIAGLLDGGATGVGLESTVAMAGADGRVHVLRPGGISLAQLEQASGCVVVATGEASSGQGDAGDLEKSQSQEGSTRRVEASLAQEAAPGRLESPHQPEAGFRPRAPGMKYTHYAPKGWLTVVAGADETAVAAVIVRELQLAREAGERTGVLAPREHVHYYQSAADLVLPCGSLADLEEAGRELFAVLRRFDEEGITWIYAETFPEEGIGLALMNRLRKAAGHRVLQA
ncbi:MAG: translation factor [Paenibacillaceae bacterium]|nr:translation factor [Paenibacillaceae bacterium]